MKRNLKEKAEYTECEVKLFPGTVISVFFVCICVYRIVMLSRFLGVDHGKIYLKALILENSCMCEWENVYQDIHFCTVGSDL